MATISSLICIAILGMASAIEYPEMEYGKPYRHSAYHGMSRPLQGLSPGVIFALFMISLLVMGFGIWVLSNQRRLLGLGRRGRLVPRALPPGPNAPGGNRLGGRSREALYRPQNNFVWDGVERPDAPDPDIGEEGPLDRTSNMNNSRRP
ncbi:hypothetical protein HDE_13098 [Halotydeus destructor]|nr:hypothetical protein HDE_13098 [Halotydeus destructor]